MKPTIFFSHSSKDKEVLLKLKEVIEDKTGGTIKIFMSSDGQSIPFGNNWMYKIEEGLRDAKIMFVFVTPKSIESGWIYFEAGYAYSKGIEVIPIGINVDIGSMKPPISLLQGFNMTSEESLNNIVHIINTKFEYSFKSDFQEKDYQNIINQNDEYSFPTICNDIINNVDTSILCSYMSGGKMIEIDKDKCFTQIVEYLKGKNISLSYDKENYSLLISGLRIISSRTSKELNIIMDSFGLINNFVLLNDIVGISFKDIREIERNFLWINIKDKYRLIIEDVKVSSILEKNNNFTIYEKSVGYFCYKDYIFKTEKSAPRYSKKSDVIVNRIGISYCTNERNALGILELINELYKIGIIYEEE